ncbi:MAG: error-prone DNA polymerase, partial [Flavobacterium sp.]
DGLRRSMATFKAKGKVSDWEIKLIAGMVAKGYDEAFARRVFRQLEGFGSYGFPESHAASFALLVYVSSYLKCYYPDVFATALLNSLPMGFYQPAQIIIDARNHGVEVREADINYSHWDNLPEEKSGKYFAIRLGFRQIKGLPADDVELLIAARRKKFTSVNELLDAGLSMFALEKLADADAFRSIGLDRRQALWEVSSLSDNPIGMFEGQPSESTNEVQLELPLLTDAEHVIEDYSSTGFSLKAHPVSFVRPQLDSMRAITTANLANMKNGDGVTIAGLITVRQRPGTAKGVIFITIEDETGFANLVVWGKVFDSYRKDIVQAKLLMVQGKVQIEGQVIHVIVNACFNLSSLLRNMSNVKTKVTYHNEDKNPEDVFHKGRNFR